MKFQAMTDVGRKRATNQDAFCCARLANGVEFMVICDGMGGHRGGNLASELAVRELGDFFSRRLTPNLRPRDLKGLLSRAVFEVSSLIEAVAGESEAFRGMGSTVVLAVRCGKKLAIAHVGDSRLYLWRGGILQRLTKDHSLVQSLIDRGEITPEEGETHPHRNVITKALGSAVDSDPVIAFCDVREKDLFLLCSDGLTVPLRDGEISEIIQNTPFESLVETLISRALAAGGPDNVTVGVLYEEEKAGK